jgi:DNA-binding transcriptional LysR family regulator
MHDIHYEDIDLNLLVVLDVLLEERHVTRAAKRLYRTQSATSHALARLRDQLDDPILVRVGGQMCPTPRAERLAPELRRLLRSIGRVLGQNEEWNPEASRRTFTIVGPDFTTAAFPRLLASLTESAPQVSVELIPPTPTMFRDVGDGHYDLGFFRVVPTDEAVICESLSSHPQTVFARRGHPALSDWGLDAWLSYPHIRIRVGEGHDSPVDVALRTLGRQRQFGPLLPHFMLAPPLLTQSDLLFTVPYGILADVVKPFDLVTAPCPLPLEPIEIALYRSRRLQRDPAISWFHSLAYDAFGATFGTQPPSPPRDTLK